MGDSGHVYLPARRLRRSLAAFVLVVAWLHTASGRPLFFYPAPTRLADGSVMSSPVTFELDQIGPAFPVIDGMAGVALLVTWAQLCPHRDACDFGLIDAVLRFWHARGRQVVLGVATVGFPYRTGDPAHPIADATPDWVLDEVATYRARSLVLGQQARVDARFPSYRDARFFEDVAGLVARLARYDGDPTVARLRIATGLLTEDNPSPAGLDYVIGGFNDREWLAYCRRVTDLFRTIFHKTPLEFDIGRLAIAHGAGDAAMARDIDTFVDAMIASHVMLAYNGLRSETRAALAPGAAEGDGVAYALRILRRAHERGDATGLELYAPSTDPAMRDRAAIVEVVRRLDPSRIVAFSTEAATVHHRRGGHAASDADSMAWIRAQPGADETQAAAETLLRGLAGD